MNGADMRNLVDNIRKAKVGRQKIYGKRDGTCATGFIIMDDFAAISDNDYHEKMSGVFVKMPHTLEMACTYEPASNRSRVI